MREPSINALTPALCGTAEEYDPWSETALHHVFAAQREAFAAEPCRSFRQRKADLRKIERILLGARQDFVEAVSRDFGHRNGAETIFADVLPTILHVRHLIRNCKRWMRPSRRRTERLFMGNRAWVEYRPKGVVGIIAPWNVPVYLALAPVATALAAGNRVILKVSEDTPETLRVMRRLVSAAFPSDQFAVFGGSADMGRAIAGLPLDHLIFTGSPRVGREIMAQAAKHLTPLTLELGGKSPAVVAPSADFAKAARRIVHGKTFNGGQICVAPDYAMVPEERIDDFVAEVRAAFAEQFPTPRQDAERTTIANQRQFQRIRALLEDARTKGARIIEIGSGANRRMPLTLILGVTDDMSVMQEEIFGPLLPVVGYQTLDQAIGHVSRGERPLALYVFARKRDEERRILARTFSGGVTLNDWGWHVVNHDLPFGGTGASGFGTYHAAEGFRELSQARAMLRIRSFFPTGWFRPPYATWVQRLAQRILLVP